MRFVGSYNLPCNWHSHNFLEIICVISGNCTNYIANQKLEMSEGDVCILAPDTTHAISVFSDDSIILNILSRFFNRTLYHSGPHPYLYFKTGHDQKLFNFIGYAYEEQI